MIAENVYGHRKRLDWIVARLSPSDRVLEVGCGTGFMITLQLIEMGFDAVGIDRDARSIEYGRDVFRDLGIDCDRLSTKEMDAFDTPFDAVIISEVLEHLNEHDALGLLGAAFDRMKPGGTLLVTVPNGYGWFELESLLWNRCRLAHFLEATGGQQVLWRVRSAFATEPVDYLHPSSLDNSPHVRRFTRGRLRRLVESVGFEVQEVTGSVLFAGPLANSLLTGVVGAMRVNGRLGTAFPGLAAAYYLHATKSEIQREASGS